MESEIEKMRERERERENIRGDGGGGDLRGDGAEEEAKMLCKQQGRVKRTP